MGSVFIRSRSVMDLALGSRSIDFEFNWREHDYSVGEDVKKVKSFVDNQERHLPTVSNLNNVQQLFLSASQRRAHNIVERFISRPYEERKASNLLLSIVSVAGGGKTVLLNCISNLLDKNHIRHQNIAATGSASAGINGRTIHSAFNLGPKSGNFEKLCDSENFRDCEFVIIEEFFMLSAALLNFINHRLQSIFNNGRPFGNCSIIGAGDPAQLMPIAYAALYSSPEGVSECQQE
jgi:chromosomal replication initiation ATPase DnaA